MKDIKDLQIWHEAIELAKDTYAMTRTFPKDEVYGLTSQIRRASVSVASNIAEGYGRKSKKDFARFLSVAIGSLYEFQTQLILSNDIGYITTQDLNSLDEKVQRLQAKTLSFRKHLEMAD